MHGCFCPHLMQWRAGNRKLALPLLTAAARTADKNKDARGVPSGGRAVRSLQKTVVSMSHARLAFPPTTFIERLQS